MIPSANIKKLKTGRDLQLKSSYASIEAARYDCTSNLSEDEGYMDSIEKKYTPKSNVFNSLKFCKESNDSTPLLAFN